MYGITPPSVLKVLRCPTCDKVVVYEWGGKRNRVYCSKACFRRTVRNANHRTFIPYLTGCDQCGSDYEKRHSFQRFCCNKCRHDFRNRQPEFRIELARRTKEFQKTPMGKALALRKKLIRKKKIRDSGELVVPDVIFARDKWRCQLCRCRVVSATSTYNPLAATLDHIIPLSRGGGHTWANIQTACNLCNSKKNAKTIGQFRLF